jgi:cytochrome c peroxidase
MAPVRGLRSLCLLAVAALLCSTAPAAGLAGALDVETSQASFDDHADVCLSPPPELLEPEEREALIAKGEELFHSTEAFAQQPSRGPLVDGQLLSCATCHAGPGFTDGLVHMVGPTEHREQVPRNTPHLLRLAGNGPFGWDGRFPCLQAAAKNAITSPLEMYSAQEPSQEQLDALAAFVETLDAPDAVPGVDYDPDLAAQGKELFADYRRARDVTGEFVFFDGVSCLHCHFEPDGTDRDFHRILLPPPLLDIGGIDPGHIDDAGRVRGFKTPVLRGVRFTAPYFHDGSLGDPTGVFGPTIDDPPVVALLEVMAAYRARFLTDFTPEEELAIVHYMLSL